MRDNERAAQVVRFWRAIEMFSPQGVPKPTSGFSGGGSQTILDVGSDELAPWQPGHPLTARPLRDGMTWQFTVYGGLYEVSAARTELVKAFGEDSKPEDGRGGGETALFAFTVDANGCLLENSATLSACAWAISRLRSPGPAHSSWLDGFEVDELDFAMGLNRLVPPKLTPAAEVGQERPPTAANPVMSHVKSAAIDAVAAGAKATGSVVGSAAAAVVTSVSGPVVGGIAGKIAGTFAERLLTPPAGSASKAGATSAANVPRARIPRLTLTARALHEFVRELSVGLDLVSALGSSGVRVQCTQVPIRDGDEAVEQTFLNSFIANDLARVERAVRDGDVGTGIANYLADLRDIATGRRVDVRANRDAVVSGVAPNGAPGGRWPAAATKPLVISQQFAVNQVMRELSGGGGIFAVNGPPGTGKTTMLRDVLAAIVVERAQRLAALRNPTEAFTEVLERVQLGKNYQAVVRGIQPELTGFEIVVATASNDAAANVTAEIPGVGAVRGAEEEALAADYFRDLASQVLGGPAWGMVAAVLGNMKNRSTFVKRFWYGDGPGTKRDRPSAARPDPASIGMMEILRQARSEAGSIPVWATAVTRFRDAEAEVRKCAAFRQDAANAITELGRLQGDVHAARHKLAEANAACSSLNETLRQSVESLERAKVDFGAADYEYRNHANHKPGFWVSLSTLFRAGRRWYAESVNLAVQRSAARSRLDEISQLVARLQSDLSVQLANRQWCAKEVADVERHAASVRARVDAACARWPTRVPHGEDLADDERFQLCAPWADEEFTLARNRLFLEALRLHKAFILNAETAARGNLAVAVAAIRGRLPLRPTTLLAAWQSLFLVVPMISTTFASLPRLFGGLGRESFGWLFIDEAGQATPQQAVGGLWRSRRTVIVGDPQQLEPVVTLPSSAQHAIRRYHGVDDQWTPDRTSVQRIADRLALHGTTLREPDGEQTVWVGAPLRVHRRCDRPIFQISNVIAYGGDLMVYGTSPHGDFPGENAWIDVSSGQSQGNWVPAEGTALVDLFTELAGLGIAPQDIRVISPFRDVVRGSKETVRNAFGRDFANNNVGTVHTVQGQESDIIVLVLGSAPRNPGARDWAAEKPNLLNVAVSRAKRRLYVIGNRSNWKDLRYFDVLATSLTVR